jgi:hypothetical protein
MKTLSLKLDDKIFSETEKLSSELNQARNRYINEAVDLYNKFNQRRILKKKFKKDSLVSQKESIKILHEFESLVDDLD